MVSETSYGVACCDSGKIVINVTDSIYVEPLSRNYSIRKLKLIENVRLLDPENEGLRSF